MVIIYYRDKDGKITHHHTPHPPELTLQELEERAEEFNRERTDGKTAHVIEAEDDSLTVYLHQKAMERKRLDKEALQDVISSIENALDTVRGLER